MVSDRQKMPRRGALVRFARLRRWCASVLLGDIKIVLGRTRLEGIDVLRVGQLFLQLRCGYPLASPWFQCSVAARI
jgi:hypothetical protein